LARRIHPKRRHDVRQGREETSGGVPNMDG
jgi:hypothetical protein